MSKAKKYFKVFLINFFIFFLGILILESFFGGWLKKNNFSDLIVKKNITKVWSPVHYKSDHNAMYKKDKYGFRGNYENISQVKIITVGGSTTDERWIDENLTWTRMLQEKIIKHINDKNYKIANAGVDGQSSLGHLKNFDYWFSKIEKLNPKFYIFYIGINDAVILADSLEKNSSENFNRADHLKDKNPSEKIVNYIKNNSAVYNLHKILDGYLIAKKYGVSHGTDTWKGSFEKKKIEIYNKSDQIDKFLKDYNDRLIKISNKVKKESSTSIFITQQVPQGHYLEELLILVNQQTIKFCKFEKQVCLNLHQKINLEMDKDLYDAFHTRPNGNKKISKFIFKELVSNPKLKIYFSKIQ